MIYLFCDFYRTNGVVSNMSDNAILSIVIQEIQAVRLWRLLWDKPHSCSRAVVMDSPVAWSVAAPTFTATLPSWTLPRGREPDDLTAAFAPASH